MSRIPDFHVRLDANRIGVEIDFRDNFLNDGSSKRTLLEHICDKCEWSFIGRPTHGIVQFAEAVITEELNYLVAIGALCRRSDGFWVYNYKTTERRERKYREHNPSSDWYKPIRNRHVDPEEVVETFAGAEDFEDAA